MRNRRFMPCVSMNGVEVACGALGSAGGASGPACRHCGVGSPDREAAVGAAGVHDAHSVAAVSDPLRPEPVVAEGALLAGRGRPQHLVGRRHRRERVARVHRPGGRGSAEHGLHDAFELDRNGPREGATLGQEPAEVAVEGGLVELEPDAAAVALLLVPGGQGVDRGWAQAGFVRPGRPWLCCPPTPGLIGSGGSGLGAGAGTRPAFSKFESYQAALSSL
jgi:hypothetical protein